MALASPAALLVLVLVADNAREYVGGAIFGVSLLLLFSTSSAYHLIERGQAVLQRIDRSMIFVIIAFFQRLNLTLVAAPLQNLVTTIVDAIPNLIKAGILILGLLPAEYRQ